MLKANAVWKIRKEPDQAAVDFLTTDLKLDPMLANLLVARGIMNEEQVTSFLGHDTSQHHDPFLMLNMDRAVHRIRKAIQSRENIWIYGDYDADGVSATALLLKVFEQQGLQVDYYIPHRTNEGYGLNKHAIEKAHRQQVSLMITVDNGISANQHVKYAADLGIDCIVTDHHEPPDVLPDAFAILNPRQPGCIYPFKDLAGVGVALKLAQALLQDIPHSLFQLAAIGTVADIMPLVGENRYIVKSGLEAMRLQPLLGIQALSTASSIEPRELTEMHIGFSLGPRINATGRLENARSAVTLLTTSSDQEAMHLANQLDYLNRERQAIVSDITNQVMALIQGKEIVQDEMVLIVAHEGWHTGVIGIVASKIVEQFHRPTVILNIDPTTGLAKGSARSIPGYDMYRALSECDTLMTHYGGHQMAAGMTLPVDNIAAFRQQMNKLAEEWLEEQHLVPAIEADMCCSIEQVTIARIEQIETMAPFGQGNTSPYFIMKHLRVHDLRLLGKEKQHLKLLVSQENNNVTYTLDAIGFNLGNKIHQISPNASIDLLGELTVNDWNGIQKPQLRIRDMRIDKRQVFDWRGRLNMQWKARLDTDWHPAIILTSFNQLSQLKLEVHDGITSIWLCEDDKAIVPLNERAHDISFAELKDIVLYALPQQVTHLQAVLAQADKAERIYAGFSNDDQASGELPSRSTFKRVYSELLQLKQWQSHDQNAMQHIQRRTGISRNMIGFICDVFEELSFIELTGTAYQCVSKPVHRELHTSFRYQQRKHRSQVEELLVYSSTEELTDWLLNHLPCKSDRT